jgi:hypothetical protein
MASGAISWLAVAKDIDHCSALSTGKWQRLLGSDEPAVEVLSFETQNDVQIYINVHISRY